jgi:hypothetical protein
MTGEALRAPEMAATAVPPVARWLGGTGALPFLALALAALAGPAGWREASLLALAAYGAVILSFLGGIQWGLAIAPGAPAEALARRLTISILPSLAGWAALLMPRDVGLIVLAGSLVAVLAVDLRAVGKAEAPGWYRRLRWPLTLAATASLLAGTVA